MVLWVIKCDERSFIFHLNSELRSEAMRTSEKQTDRLTSFEVGNDQVIKVVAFALVIAVFQQVLEQVNATLDVRGVLAANECPRVLELGLVRDRAILLSFVVVRLLEYLNFS